MVRWGSCDFHELEDFRDRLEDADKQKFFEDCAKELAARLLAKAVKRTPVGQYDADSGKTGGTLRRGWTTDDSRQAMYMAMFGGGEGGGTKSTGSQKDVYGADAVGEHTKSYANHLEVTKNGNDYVIEITNPIEYASYVEYGHRTRGHKGWVPGKFMMTISEKEVNNLAPGVLQKKLEKFLREVFHA